MIRRFFPYVLLLGAASLRGQGVVDPARLEAAHPLGPGRVFHVSPSGDDSQPGTPALPWRTIARVNAESFLAGDHVRFEGGATFDGSLELAADDAGTAAAPIVIDSFGAGRATVHAGSRDGLFAWNTAGLEIRGIDFRGDWDATTQAGSSGTGIELYTDLPGTTRLPHVVVEDVDVSGFKQSGIELGAWPADATMGGFRDVRIERCSVHDNGDAGVSSYGYWDPSSSEYAHHDVVVRDCRVFRNRGIVGSSNHTGNGIVLGGVADVLVERCEAFENGDLCNHRGGGPVGIWCWDATRVVIQHCESHHNRTGAASGDGGGFDLDGGTTASVMQYCYSHDNDGAGYLVYQFFGARPLLGANVVRWNVSENDGRRHAYGPLYVGGGSEVRDNAIYGNTFFVSPAAGATPAAVTVDRIGVSNTFRNNVVVATGRVPLLRSDEAYSATRFAFQGNDWHSPDPAEWIMEWGPTATLTSLAAFRAAGGERLGVTDAGTDVDPLLAAPGSGGTIGDPSRLTELDAYRLLPGSPIADAGLDLETLFGIDPGPRDYFGNLLPQGAAVGIGAHDAAGSACVLPVEVGGLRLTRTGTTLQLTWVEALDADSYVVREERVLPGSFATVTGTAPSGAPSLTAPIPPDALVFYLVAGVNACGEGP